MVAAAAGLAIWLGLIGPSSAQSAADAAAQWGLLGTWRIATVDCNAPGSRQSTLQSWVARGGRLFNDRDFGDARDSTPVEAGVIRPDGILELTMVQPDQSRRALGFFKRPDGLKRAMYNYDMATTQYSVRDGRFAANGAETPLQKRCR